MLDCGSNSFETVNYLNLKKIKSIIIDHHEIHKPYPKTKCLINPKKECDYNEFDYFCTSTLAYFFINSFFDNKILKKKFEENLIYVLLALVCDVMPLRNLNKIIAKRIFKEPKKYRNYLFDKIFESKKINRNFEIDDFGFLIGPIINSVGRLDDANKIIQLLTEKNIEKKSKIIIEALKINEKRKIEDDIIRKLNFDQLNKIEDNIIILYQEIINEGIVGIIASKLKEYFNKPSIVLTKSGDIYKGSARSTYNFNIGKFIKQGIDKGIILDGEAIILLLDFQLRKERLMNLRYL